MLSRFVPIFILIFACLSPAATAQENADKPPAALRGVMHVHSRHSHDSTLPLRLLIDEGAKMGLDFVFVTDHNSMEAVQDYQKIKKAEKPILIFGSEISSSSGHLLSLGIKEAVPTELKTPAEIAKWTHEKGGFIIIPHPFSAAHPWADWEFKDWDGLEVYNFGHQLYEQNAVDFYLRSFSEDSEELIKSFLKIKPEPFKHWDKEMAKRKVIGSSGTDAHLKKSEKTFKAALQSAIVHVMAPSGTEDAIVQAIKEARLFSVFESLGKISKFSFTATVGETAYQIGDTAEIPPQTQIQFKVQVEASLAAPPRIKLFRNGKKVLETTGLELTHTGPKSGAYRIEVFQGTDLWIFSNPVYIQASPSDAPAQPLTPG